jgi:hypothetical protein
MKTRIVHVAVLIVLVMLLPALLQAQMAIKQPLVRVDIPFAFSAGGVHLPAGQYHISHPGDPYFVLIEKDDGRARALVYVHPAATASSESTKLVFNRYGDQYFLSQVLTEPDRQVHQCFKCRREKELIAQVKKAESVVAVAKH